MDERTFRISVGCKINLFLHITGRRPDGYHELLTLFYPLPEPCDALDITALADDAAPGLTLSCSDPALAGDGNLIAKAYRAFAAATGYSPALRIHLAKGIPMGAGLGGGSADAAALLRFMNDRAGPRALAEGALNRLAAGLGADVPFFLLGRPALATSIGDELTPMEVDLRGMTILLACPDVHVNTAWAYKAWDRAVDAGLAAPGRPISALTGQEVPLKSPVCPADMALANDFEQVVLPAHPELAAIKQELVRLGAAMAVMSGSGAAFFALFQRRDDAASAAGALAGKGLATHLVEPRRGVAKR